jgi:hypothetical protein
VNHAREELTHRRSRPSESASVGLSESFQLRLTAYATAAAAAGVGLLTATPPAEAEIVFTSAHTTFTSGTVFIDLNHDGINDFYLSIYNFDRGDRRLAARGLAGANQVQGYILSGYPPLALRAGQRIGSRDSFFSLEAPAANVAATFGTVVSGPFANAGIRFLGLRFKINSEVHFGWAALNVKAHGHNHVPHIEATLLGYAYETVAGQGLLAGQTAANFYKSERVPRFGTLGMLALGAPALNLWRREDEWTKAPG